MFQKIQEGPVPPIPHDLLDHKMILEQLSFFLDIFFILVFHYNFKITRNEISKKNFVSFNKTKQKEEENQ